MIKKIEFVCTANNGKSPVALAIARNYLGKVEKYVLSSTGTMVDIITKSDGIPLSKYLEQFCDDAYDRSILSEKEIKNLETNPRRILEKLLINERENRNKYLGELGLQFVNSPTQTHQINDRRIIACIGNSNLKRVEKIYSKLTNPPKIVNLMGENYPDFSNQWALTYDEFKNIAKGVREATISLLDKEL